jgi:hypothetical protein
MDIKIQWQDTKGNWQPFDTKGILHMPRNHALNLFRTSTPVIIKEGEEYITNSSAVFEQYQKSKRKIMMLGDIGQSEARLEVCGFLGE